MSFRKVSSTLFHPLSVLAVVVSFLCVACSGTAFVDGGAGSGGGATTTSSGTGSGGSGTTTGSTGGGTPGCECAAPYFPVCGVDGQTHDAACGPSCVPVDVDCEGECPCDRCEAMGTTYRDLVAQLKQCDASIDVPQCTTLIPHDLVCGCNTFINPSNDGLYQALLQLIAEWEASNCDTDILCEPCAADPASGSCQADTGRVDACVDVFD